MSSTEAEKTTIGTSDLSYKYSGPEDTIEKGDPPKLLKENFPNLLSARVSRIWLPNGARALARLKTLCSGTLDKLLSFSDPQLSQLQNDIVGLPILAYYQGEKR